MTEPYKQQGNGSDPSVGQYVHLAFGLAGAAEGGIEWAKLQAGIGNELSYLKIGVGAVVAASSLWTLWRLARTR